jgi:hypothetical protein
MLRLEKDLCKDIAWAMVENWMNRPFKPVNLVDLYHESDFDVDIVVDKLTRDLYATIECCGDDSFYQLLEALYPHFKAHIQDVWEWYARENGLPLGPHQLEYEDAYAYES